MKHERRVVGHASGWQEQMDTCVCGKPWPCSGDAPLLTSNQLGWIALSEREPPKDCPRLLVTNLLTEKNAFGHMSHLWLTYMVHRQDDGSYCAFAEDDTRIHNLTHWRYAVPEDCAHETSPDPKHLTYIGNVICHDSEGDVVIDWVSERIKPMRGTVLYVSEANDTAGCAECGAKWELDHDQYCTNNKHRPGETGGGASTQKASVKWECNCRSSTSEHHPDCRSLLKVPALVACGNPVMVAKDWYGPCTKPADHDGDCERGPQENGRGDANEG